MGCTLGLGGYANGPNGRVPPPCGPSTGTACAACRREPADVLFGTLPDGIAVPTPLRWNIVISRRTSATSNLMM